MPAPRSILTRVTSERDTSGAPEERFGGGETLRGVGKEPVDGRSTEAGGWLPAATKGGGDVPGVHQAIDNSHGDPSRWVGGTKWMPSDQPRVGASRGCLQQTSAGSDHLEQLNRRHVRCDADTGWNEVVLWLRGDLGGLGEEAVGDVDRRLVACPFQVTGGRGPVSVGERGEGFADLLYNAG